jgi:hypothetical protein
MMTLYAPLCYTNTLLREEPDLAINSDPNKPA